MAIPASRYTLGMDREVTRETAANRARTSLMRKGLRQAKKEKNYEKALGFANDLDTEGMSAGMTGSAEDVASIATGRVASREALSNQMRSQIPNVMGQTRGARIAAAKADGSFAAKRDQFNKANTGKKVMDEAGNITDAPMPPAGGGTTTTGEKPAAGGGTTTDKPEVTVVPAGGEKPAGAPGAKPVAAQTKRLSSRDMLAAALREGRVVDPELEKRFAEEDAKKAAGTKLAKPAEAPAATTPQKSAAAGKKATSSSSVVTGPPNLGVVTGPPNLGVVTGPPTESQMQGPADWMNQSAWEYNPIPQDQADQIRTVAGRGSDAVSRLAQVLNPITTFSTLRQGGTSDLPSSFGPQPTYANANDRLAGDTQAIRDAQSRGLLKTQRTKDKFGEKQIQILRPSYKGSPLPLGSSTVAGARAKGGPVKAGEPYLVGEEGPEIVVPDEDGEVIANKDLKKKKTRKLLQAALSKK